MSGTSYLPAREVFHIAHRAFRESKELEKWSFIYSWRLCLRGEVRTVAAPSFLITSLHFLGSMEPL